MSRRLLSTNHESPGFELLPVKRTLKYYKKFLF